ncbi:MAG: hypothetical protein LKM38_30395 [Pseudomonas veronii]|jgi:branched-chain amino acid transport system permease protein|nr:hypothetical protein [Pseudomonas veronii]
MIFFGVLVILVLQYARGGLLPLLSGLFPRAQPRPLPEHPAHALPRRTMPANGQPLMVAEGLLKQFGGLVANKDMGLTVNGAEITALIGPNGAGKFDPVQSVVRGAGAQCRPRSFFSASASTACRRVPSPALGMSRTFQHVKLLPSMSVLENVAIGAHLRGESAACCPLPGGWTAAKRKPACWPKPGAATAPRGAGRYALHDPRRQPGAGPAADSWKLPERCAPIPCVLLLDEPAAGLRHQEKAALAALPARITAQRWDRPFCWWSTTWTSSWAWCDHLVVMEFGEKMLPRALPEEIQAESSRAAKPIWEAYEH